MEKASIFDFVKSGVSLLALRGHVEFPLKVLLFGILVEVLQVLLLVVTVIIEVVVHEEVEPVDLSLRFGFVLFLLNANIT